MNKFDEIKEYLGTVCDQIRWKKARSVVADELETHILDQRDAFIQDGRDHDAATKDAIAEMGDAVTVGTMLDQSYRPHMDWKALAVMLSIIFCSILLSILLWRTGSWQEMLALFFVWGAIYVVVALPFCLIDFTCYAKIPKILFFSLAACLVLSGAGVTIFWYVESTVIALLPFAALLFMFGMRGGGYRKFVRCAILFVVLPCIGYFVFLYFRYYGYLYNSWRIWAVSEYFIVFVLNSVAMLTICVCNGFFQVSKKKALLTLYIPAIACVVLFLVYSNLVQQYDGTRYEAGTAPMDSMRDMLQNSVLLGHGHEVAVIDSNEIARLIYRCGWLPFFALLAVVAGLYTYLFQRCIRQRSVLGRTLSLMGWTTLVIPTTLGLLNGVGLMPNAFHVIPFLNDIYAAYACMVLGLLCNIFRNGDVVRDHKIKAIA